MFRPAAAAGLLMLTALAGCLAPAAPVTPATSLGPVLIGDVAALVHRVGDNASAHAAEGVQAVAFAVNHEAAEPTLGITKEGVLFYAAATFSNDVAGVPFNQLPRTDILRSKDHGATWEDVTPYFPGGLVREHPETGDPYVYVDESTGRVFDIDQRAGTTCYTVVTSDDLGATWSVPPSIACATPGMADHQTIVAAKARTVPTTGYPNVVVVCYNIVATSMCTRSLDGGATFVPTGPVGSQGVALDKVGPGFVVVNTTDPLNSDLDPSAVCSGLVGHLKAAPDGTLYLPRRQCDAPMLGISSDDGTSWNLVRVSDARALHRGGTLGMDPTVAVDADGVVSYVFQGEDGHLLLTTSADRGASWTPAVDVLAPGLTVGNLAALAPGANGTLALAYLGSTVAGGVAANTSAVENSTWDGYLAFIEGAGSPSPTVTTARVNPAADPLYRGSCGIGRCGWLRDFIDLVVDTEGRPWAAFADGCVEKCAGAEGTFQDTDRAVGLVATLSAGPSLRNAGRILPAL